MAINFPSDLVITNNNFPLIKAEHQSIQGFMRVDTVVERNNIPSNKRIESAIIVVGDTNTPYIFEGANTGDTEWQDAGNWKNLTPPPAPDEGIQLSDLGALNATPSGLGNLSYNNLTGDFTLTPTDISGKADQSALNSVITDVSTNASDIDALETSQAAQDTLIAGKASQADLDAAEADIVTNTTNIATNTANIAGAVGDISGNATDISNLEAEQLTQNTNISANASDIDALEASQAAQDTAIAGKVGNITAGTNIDSVTNVGDNYTINAADAPVQTITSGSVNVTVTEPTTGDFEISVAAGADAETTFAYTTTDAIGSIPAGTNITIGTPLEDIIRDMLVSYQNLVLSIGNSFPTLEHDTAFSQANYTLNRTNPQSSDTSANSGACTFVDEFGSGDVNFAYTPDGTSSQSINVGVSFTPVVSPTATAGQDGQAKNNNSGNFLQFAEDNTLGATRTTRKDYRVWFRRYFGASLLNVTSGNLATIFPSLLSNMQDSALSSDSYGNYIAPPDSQADPADSFLYFICPECHITAGDYIITDGSFDITTAWPVLGEVDHNGCAYRVLVSDTPASYAPGQLITLEQKPA
jgi:hypothetical protein